MHFIKSQRTTMRTEIEWETENLKSWADANSNTFVQDMKEKKLFVKRMDFFVSNILEKFLKLILS